MKKIKMKALAQLVADAKAAWSKAKKEKKAADEIKKLRDHYEKHLMLYDGFSDDGKKEDEEVEIPDEKAADQPNVLETAEVQTMIQTAVTNGLKALLPEHLQTQLTPENVRQFVQDGIKAALGENRNQPLSGDLINKVVEMSAKAAFEKISLPSRFQNGGDDAPQGGSRIEVPCSLSKGNLPLHMKQLLNVIMGKPENDGVTSDHLRKGEEHADAMWLGLKMQGIKALTTTGTGTGAEWIPRSLSAEIYRRMYLDSLIAQAFLATEVQMPTDPYDYPLITTDPIFYLNNVENKEGKPSDLGTGKITLTTQTLMAACQFSYKVNEDAIIPVLPTIQAALGRAGARALENAILNGDDSATHMDSDVTDQVNDQQKAWKGFRKLALAASLKVDLSTGGLSRANLLSLIKMLGKWGARPNDLLWIVGVQAWAGLLNLDEVVLAYARGQAGTYATGGPTPAPWGGMILPSEMLKENLNASGVYDGSVTSKGTIIVVSKAGFILGSRREFLLETDRNIRSQTFDLVASFRKAFQPVETPSATIKTVAVGYNYPA